MRDDLSSKGVEVQWAKCVDDLVAGGMKKNIAREVAYKEIVGESFSVVQAKERTGKADLTNQDFTSLPEGDILQSIPWVFARLKIKDVDPRTAPSRTAYNLWFWATRAEENKDQFVNLAFSKLPKLESLQDLETRKRDDQRKMEKLFDVIGRALLKSTEEIEGKLSVPPPPMALRKPE